MEPEELDYFIKEFNMDYVRDKKISQPSISSVKKQNIIYENCQIEGVVLSDIHLKDIKFIDCIFDHVIVEASYFENILVKDCSINSLRIRGNRDITQNKFSFSRKNGILKEVDLIYNNKIKELVLCGNLKIENCNFPVDNNHTHVMNPFGVYFRCFEFIDKNWQGEKKRIGLLEIQEFYISKDIKNQNEDFITYLENEDLDETTNSIIYDVYKLIREIDKSIP